MTKTAWKVLENLLRLASDVFQNHGCNDFWVADTAEGRELVRVLAIQEGCEFDEMPKEKDGQFVVSDAVAMLYFADWAREQAEK